MNRGLIEVEVEVVLGPDDGSELPRFMNRGLIEVRLAS